MSENANNILPDIRDEAARLTTSVLESGLHARLLGGLAVWLRCPSVRTGPFARSRGSILSISEHVFSLP